MPNFAHLLRAAGFVLKGEPVADGRIHRCHVKGDRAGTRNGWYVLFPDPLAGAFGHWKSGLSEKWCAGSGANFTPAQRKAFAVQIAADKAAREAEEEPRVMPPRGRLCGYGRPRRRCSVTPICGARGCKSIWPAPGPGRAGDDAPL
jgi:hypothetical protein